MQDKTFASSTNSIRTASLTVKASTFKGHSHQIMNQNEMSSAVNMLLHISEDATQHPSPEFVLSSEKLNTCNVRTWVSEQPMCNEW